jgi:hypothetical protein
MTPCLDTQALQLLELADIAAGSLMGVKLHLYQNNLVFNPDTVVLADLVEATFATYAAVVLTWDTPSVSDDGHPEIHSDRVTWRPTSSATPNDIYGYYITDAASAVLLAGGTFENGPLPMHSTLDAILTTIVYRLGEAGYCSTIS